MTLKEQAYGSIQNLMVRFEEQLPSYKKSDYNETLVRKDFIDPFFKALGWDVDNSQGYAEAYREVIHEDRVKVGGATKAPDYSFRLPGGKRLFFVEAKKPSVLIKEEVLPAYQVHKTGGVYHTLQYIVDLWCLILLASCKAKHLSSLLRKP